MRLTAGYASAALCDVYGPTAEMDPAELTMAERLRELGYATGIFGKRHLGRASKEQWPNHRSFDEFYDFLMSARG